MGTPQATGADRPGNRTARAARLACLVAVVAVLATGCSANEVLRFGWPEGITPQADSMRVFWTWSVVAALIIGVITWALILWPVVAHRKRGDRLPKQFQYNHFLEIIYTGLPVIIVVVLFYFTATTQNYVQAETDDPDVVVDVVAFQWNWEFDYVSYKDTAGVEQEPAAPGDDTVRTIGSSAEIPLLVLPNDRVIEYRLRSTDVIHSFFVPDFLFKRDVFPHPDKNNQDWDFQNRIDQTGSFVGRCAELCGTYHAVMNFEVRVVTPEIFDQYMDLRTTVNPATGKGYTAAEALAEIDCGDLCTPHAVTTKPFDTDRTAREASGS
ncbi:MULTISPECIES: aa3-type cytochrome oxidase subunit II [Actinokineospora]|uniref:cytochrome-c oxidase n=1 Tax=Actinokineospora fastidiosa TaxID=1816 RepID=A0A918LFL1_9PSEU|nr:MULTISPECIES: cytochrome c oxidase subunit II [Actinokineospora]UVS77841.1 Cytochrome c oxidase subunit 2 precursor [Actinokineospora sp. UTMC 2448]GGS40633.1 cytochrome c oxidase subunit II [Actinokineospora fastidiosa]